MKRRRLEAADIVRSCKTSFSDRYTLSSEQRKAIRDIAACSTALLGGHRFRCDRCEHQQISYNSCRNRHCPKCQGVAQARWMRERSDELLPVPYFHIVFTLPRQLGPIALQNQRTVYAILFQTVSETLQTIARDPRHLGARIGFIALLQTWGQNLMHHPHLHCLVPGGGLFQDKKQWISCSPGFLLSVRVLSRFFRRCFLRRLKQAYSAGKLTFHGKLQPLRKESEWRTLVSRLQRNEWVVYSKPPFGGPQQVLKYLARYTHRTALANSRLISYEKGRVAFTAKDYRRKGRRRTITVEDHEFLRRFLLHVLPRGFVRIRSYGYLSNRLRKKHLKLCRRLINPDSPEQAPTCTKKTEADSSESRTQLCPVCKQGRMIRGETIPPGLPEIVEERIRAP